MFSMKHFRCSFQKWPQGNCILDNFPTVVLNKFHLRMKFESDHYEIFRLIYFPEIIGLDACSMIFPNIYATKLQP